MTIDRLRLLSERLAEMLKGSGCEALGQAYTGCAICPHPELDAYEVRFSVRRPVQKRVIDHDALDNDEDAARVLSKLADEAKGYIAQELRALANQMDPPKFTADGPNELYWRGPK